MDIYDKEIAYLTDQPDQIYNHWNNTSNLFGKVINKFHPLSLSLKFDCGCLTQIRCDEKKAETFELEIEIRNDDRIPPSPDNPDNYPDKEVINKIEIEDLPVFAEWQRKIDIALNRVVPVNIVEFNSFFGMCIGVPSNISSDYLAKYN